MPQPGSSRTTLRIQRSVVGCLFVLLTLLGGWLGGLALPDRVIGTAAQTTSDGALRGESSVPASCQVLDLECHLDELAQHLSMTMFTAIEPLLQSIQQNPGNFVTQTPPEVTYSNVWVIRMSDWLRDACLLAVGLLLLLNAYHLLLAHSVGAPAPEVLELLPRVLLASMACWMSLTIGQWFIDFNNALCGDELSFYQLSLLSTLIENIVHIFTHIDALGNALLLILLGLLASLLILWLLWQMLVRLALVVVLLVLAPLGLLCFGFPLTERWGRLWLSAFSSAVLLQGIQVTALVIGGLCLAAFTDQPSSTLGLGASGMTLLVGGAILWLVNQLPGMLREASLRPMVAAGQRGGSGGVSSNAAFVFVSRAVSTILV